MGFFDGLAIRSSRQNKHVGFLLLTCRTGDGIPLWCARYTTECGDGLFISRVRNGDASAVKYQGL